MAQLAARVGAIPFLSRRNALAILDIEGHSLWCIPGGVTTPFAPNRDRGPDSFRAGRTGFLRPGPSGIPCDSYTDFLGSTTPESCSTIANQRVQRKLQCLGLPGLLGIDPEVFSDPTSAALGNRFGPLPISTLPAQIHTRVLPADPVRGEPATPPAVMPLCGGLLITRVVQEMQLELDRLAEELQDERGTLHAKPGRIQFERWLFN